MTLQQQLAELEKAFKAITVGDLGDAVLQPEKFNKFIREVQNASPILDASRRLPMASQQKDIDRIHFGSRILKTGAGTPAEVKPTFATNSLICVKARGRVEIKDDTLEDNIERGALEDTLLTLIGERVGLDVEELFVQGDTGSGDAYLALTDGWNKLAGNQFDETDADPTEVEAYLKFALDSMPQQYRRNRQNMRFWVSYDIEDAYREVLKGRGTGLGDSAQTGSGVLAYKGIPLIEVPNQPDGSLLLAPMDNLVWGAWRNVKIEKFRDPENEQTQFWISVRTDCNYEDEDAAVFGSGYTG